MKDLPPREVFTEHKLGKFNREEARLATRRADVGSDLPINWLINPDQATYLPELQFIINKMSTVTPTSQEGEQPSTVLRTSI